MRYQFLFLGFNSLEQFGWIDFFIFILFMLLFTLENVERNLKNGKKKNEMKKIYIKLIYANF